MLKGADIESVRNLKWYKTSSARIMHKDYWDNRYQKPLDINIANPDEIINALEDIGITAVKRVEFSGDLILNSVDFGEDGNMSVLVTAIDTKRDFNVFHFEDGHPVLSEASIRIYCFLIHL